MGDCAKTVRRPLVLRERPDETIRSHLSRSPQRAFAGKPFGGNFDRVGFSLWGELRTRGPGVLHQPVPTPQGSRSEDRHTRCMAGRTREYRWRSQVSAQGGGSESCSRQIETQLGHNWRFLCPIVAKFRCHCDSRRVACRTKRALRAMRRAWLRGSTCFSAGPWRKSGGWRSDSA
jgi:hypothetical protein